jgi:hypothetical protein
MDFSIGMIQMQEASAANVDFRYNHLWRDNFQLELSDAAESGLSN